MARVTRVPLSASALGFPVKVTPTATPGEAVHAGTTKKDAGFDSITLHAINSHNAAVVLSLEITDGTTTETMAISLPANSRTNDILKDMIVKQGYTVRAFAATADVVFLTGYCDQTEMHAANPAYLA